MTEKPSQQAAQISESGPGHLLETLLIFLAVFVAVLGLGLALAAVIMDDTAWRPGAMRVVWGVVGALVLLSVAVILWALSSLISRVGQLEARAELSAEPIAPPGPDLSELVSRLDRLQGSVDSLNPSAPVVDGEPSHVSGEELASQIEAAMARRGWDQAEELLGRYEAQVGLDDRAEALRSQLDQQRNEAEDQHKADLFARVEDLMSAGRFEEARTIGLQLQDSYPQDPQVQRQMERIRRERQAYQQDQVQRLYRKVQSQAKQRHWQAALEAGEHLQKQYPDRPEAQLVEIIMETLRDNARLEKVRELRDRIRDLISRRRYGEALELARQVVRDYPETAAARELSDQMDRLEARANQEE
jgi:outer membrane protein assembly factor BamD (BamD/ComL family)